MILPYRRLEGKTHGAHCHLSNTSYFRTSAMGTRFVSSRLPSLLRVAARRARCECAAKGFEFVCRPRVLIWPRRSKLLLSWRGGELSLAPVYSTLAALLKL